MLVLRSVKIKPFDKGDAGHITSSKSPFVGTAGIVGYSITSPSGTTIYIRLLASNPYLSFRSNWACVSISRAEDCINQDTYNTHYYNKSQSASLSFEGKTLNVSYHSFCLHKNWHVCSLLQTLAEQIRPLQHMFLLICDMLVMGLRTHVLCFTCYISRNIWEYALG